MKESELERYVIRCCLSYGMMTFKFVSPNNRGVPDRIIISNGRVLFLELKQPGKKPTKLQELVLSRLRAAGCKAFWTDSKDEAKHIIYQHYIST